MASFLLFFSAFFLEVIQGQNGVVHCCAQLNTGHDNIADKNHIGAFQEGEGHITHNGQFDRNHGYNSKEYRLKGKHNTRKITIIDRVFTFALSVRRIFSMSIVAVVSPTR